MDNIFAAAERVFHGAVDKLPESTKQLYAKCGGLNGLFNISSSEAKATSLPTKRECVRQLVAGGIKENIIRNAFINMMERRGNPTWRAVMFYDEMIVRFHEEPMRYEVR